MTGYLLDTNVVSEPRKGARADVGVRAWMADRRDDDLFLSVLTIGELHTGVERIRRRDPRAAGELDTWLGRLVAVHVDRILDIDLAVVRCWAALSVPDPVPVIDGLIAATALTHGLTVVTRNVRDFRGSGVQVVNPFTDGRTDPP